MPLTEAGDGLTDTDAALLRLLEAGRVTPTYAAEQIGTSHTWATKRLRHLEDLGRVNRLAHGLYELADGSEADSQATDTETRHTNP